MDDGEVAERCVELGILPPLTRDTFGDELSGLEEDLLNWENQHPPIPVGIHEAFEERRREDRRLGERRTT